MGKSTSFATQPSVLANQGDRCIVPNRHRRLLIRVSWRQRAAVPTSTAPPSLPPVVASPIAPMIASQQPAPHQQKSAFTSSDPPVSAPATHIRGPTVPASSSGKPRPQPKTAKSSSKSRRPPTAQKSSTKKDVGLKKRRSRTESIGKDTGGGDIINGGGVANGNGKDTSVSPALSSTAQQQPPPPPLYHPAYECHDPPADYQRYFLGKKSQETIAESSRNITVSAPAIDLHDYAQKHPHSHHHQQDQLISTHPSSLATAEEPRQKLDCTDPNLRALIHSVEASSPSSPSRHQQRTTTTTAGERVSSVAAASPRRIPIIPSTQSHATSSSLMLVDSCLHALDGHSGAHIDHVDLGRASGSLNALIHRPAMMSDHFAKLAKAPVDAGRLGEGVGKRMSLSSRSNRRNSSLVGLLPTSPTTNTMVRPSSKGPSQPPSAPPLTSGRKRNPLPSLLPTATTNNDIPPSSTDNINNNRRRGSQQQGATAATTQQLLPPTQPEWIVGDVILVDLHLVATMGAGACVYSLTAFDQNKFINRDLVDIKIEVLDAVTDALVATLPIVPYMDGPTSINVLPCGDIESYVPPAHWGDAEDNEGLIVFPKSNTTLTRTTPSTASKGRVGGVSTNNSPTTITIRPSPSSSSAAAAASGDPDIEALSVASPTTPSGMIMKGSPSNGSRIGLLCQSMVAFELCRQKPPSAAAANITRSGKHNFTSNMSDPGGDGPLSMTTTSLASNAATNNNKPQGWVLRRVCEGYNIRNPTLVHAVVEGRYVARARALEQHAAASTFLGFNNNTTSGSKPLTKRQSSRRLLTSSRAVSVIPPPGELIGLSSTINNPLATHNTAPPTALVLHNSSKRDGATPTSTAADTTPPYNELMLSPDTININPAVRRTSSLFSESRSGCGSSDFDTLSEEEDDNRGGTGGGGVAPQTSTTAMIRDGHHSYNKGRTLRTGGDRERYGAFHNNLRTETRRAAAKLRIRSPNDSSQHQNNNNNDDDLSISTDDDGEHGLDSLPPISLHHHHNISVNAPPTPSSAIVVSSSLHHPHPPPHSSRGMDGDDSGALVVATTLPSPPSMHYRMTSPPPPPTVVSSGGAVREPLLVTAVRAGLPSFDSTSTIRYGSNCYNSGTEEGTLITHFEEHRRQYIRSGGNTKGTGTSSSSNNNTTGTTTTTTTTTPTAVTAVNPRKRLGAPPVAKGVDLMPESWLKAIEEEKMRKRGKATAMANVNMQQLERKLTTMAGGGGGDHSNNTTSQVGFSEPHLMRDDDGVGKTNEDDQDVFGGESPQVNSPTLPQQQQQQHQQQLSTIAFPTSGVEEVAAPFPKPPLPPEMEELRQFQQQHGGHHSTALTHLTSGGGGGGNRHSSLMKGKDAIRTPRRQTPSSKTTSPRRAVSKGGGLLGVATQPSRSRKPAAAFPAGLLQRH